LSLPSIVAGFVGIFGGDVLSWLVIQVFWLALLFILFFAYLFFSLNSRGDVVFISLYRRR